MNWNKPSLIAGLCFIVVLILMKLFYNDETGYEDRKSYCYFHDKMKKIHFNGRVSKIFLDRRMHLDKAIILSGNENNKHHFHGESSGFLDYLQIGDSIVKEKDELHVIVIRDTLEIIWQLEYVDCF